MLSRLHRLSSSKRIEIIKSRGQRVENNFLLLFWLKQKEDVNLTRVAFVVSSRVSKRAVTRHKVKRRLREVIRSLLSQIKPGLDMVIIAKPEARKLDFTKLAQGVSQLFQQTGLFIKV
jgi:ribonuclease P protein component